MIWTFRPYGDQFGIPGYFEADTLGQLKHGRAVISLSPYSIGPNLIGYISNSEAHYV